MPRLFFLMVHIHTLQMHLVWYPLRFTHSLALSLSFLSSPIWSIHFLHQQEFDLILCRWNIRISFLSFDVAIWRWWDDEEFYLFFIFIIVPSALFFFTYPTTLSNHVHCRVNPLKSSLALSIRAHTQAHTTDAFGLALVIARLYTSTLVVHSCADEKWR